MNISEITCLWLQPQKPNFRTISKTNGKEGWIKVAQMHVTVQMRESSGKQGFYVVLMSVRIYKTIHTLAVTLYILF